MRNIDSTRLLNFLKSFECENLFLVGDIIDSWSLKRRWNWPKINNEIVINVLKKINNNNTEVFYIIGNHDNFLKEFKEVFDEYNLSERQIYIGLNGKKYLIIHGDFFDAIVQNSIWLSHLGDIVYEIFFKLNRYIDWFRNCLGLSHWSLSRWAKHNVKNAVMFISGYEKALVKEAKECNVDGVIAGHIHHPVIKNIDGIEYLNLGDFVESYSAIVEHLDGRFELLFL